MDAKTKTKKAAVKATKKAAPKPKPLVLIDPGHGGTYVDGDGVTRYITRTGGKFYAWPDGTTVYEGEQNREVGKALAEELRRMGIATAFTVDPRDPSDPSLGDRVAIANRIVKVNPNHRVILISIHHNAAQAHTAKGFEVFTSPGEDDSDELASILFEEFKEAIEDGEFVTTKLRPDWSDGDADKEARFSMLFSDAFASILPELGFYTNAEEAKKILSPDWVKANAKVIARAVGKFSKRIK